MKFLDDGITPNTDYRPESMADLADPARGLRRLFAGPTLPRDLSPEVLAEVLADDLDGVDPREAYLSLLTTGIYRRLHRDQRRSTRARSVYCWMEHDLGPFEDAPVLSPEQAAAVAQRLDPATGPASCLPLAGLFEATAGDQSTIFTNRGPIDLASGRLVFRTAHNAQAEPGYRIYFEPAGSAPHGAGTQVLAWLPARTLHDALVASVIESVDDPQRVASFTAPAWVAKTDNAERVRELQALRDDRCADFRKATIALTHSDLSELQRALIKEEADEAERAYQTAESALRRLADEVDVAPRVEGRLDSLPDVLALLSEQTQLPAQVARGIARILNILVRDPIIRLDPDSGLCMLSGTITLPTTDGGVLRIPLEGRVRNSSTDTWLGGPGGLVLAGVPFADAWRATGKATSLGATAHWRRAIEDRLLQHPPQGGRPPSGRAAAGLLVRCPDRRVLAAALAVWRGAAPPGCRLTDAVTALLFSEATAPRDWRNARCREVLAIPDDVDFSPGRST